MTEGNGTGPRGVTGPSTANPRGGHPEAAGTVEIRDLVDDLLAWATRSRLRGGHGPAQKMTN